MPMGFCSVACMLLMVALSNVHGQPVQISLPGTNCPVENLDWRLESMENRLEDIQKIVSTMKNPFIEEDCTVDLASYGYNDSTPHGYVRTSGGSSEEILVLNHQGNHRSIQRGVTLLELDIATCTTRNRQRFDTAWNPDNRGQFLESLQLKTTGTVIVGVTADTAENDDNATFKNYVGQFFTLYNMNLRGTRYRDKFAFIMEKGFPNKTVFQTKPRYGESLIMKIVVRGSTIHDVTFVRL